MIREMLTYIGSSAAPGARRAGLVRECVAITARHKRNASAWQSHLEHCKRHITQALKRADPSKPVLVLGAGPCLDLPLEALAAHPAGAVLVDAVFLPATKKLIAKYPNLKFVLSDITGLLAGADEAKEMSALAPIDTAGYGLILSVNILSQLPLAFVSVPPEGENEKAIMQKIQCAHVNALSKSGVACLIISDYNAKVMASGRRKDYNTIESIMFNTQSIDNWTWQVAPLGELGAKRELSLTVGAWQLNWEL